MTPVAGALLAVVLASAAGAADHRDAPLISARRDLDVTDVYAFIPPSNPQAVTLILAVDPLLAPGTSSARRAGPSPIRAPGAAVTAWS